MESAAMTANTPSLFSAPPTATPTTMLSTEPNAMAKLPRESRRDDGNAAVAEAAAERTDDVEGRDAGGEGADDAERRGNGDEPVDEHGGLHVGLIVDHADDDARQSVAGGNEADEQRGESGVDADELRIGCAVADGGEADGDHDDRPDPVHVEQRRLERGVLVARVVAG